ncbi:MAG: coenzyme F420-0:L-glutamate ligase [Armatimonadota bacterium]|nr:coenzyme F420-0:L-glutamate ligase [Armatimonadota bacterium]MDR7428295.1 coenzyme F420-0:L-glutamate ligase [Armatimonadota bacterium]MDR7463235.1 coenzyme F420-0:L-glutamate ligase [Armatimonadota bacterium]MDR7469385.1 coenzyme F420-0:L-glutamate ligase [Armatimonadota bacterium]MDR7474779.1 coenzyme F420-0:L-glutamate ligase [Armatimonadota bacterium]
MQLWALDHFPEIRPGTDLPQVIVRCLRDNGLAPADGDVLVVAQKVVSKAEGRVVDLRTVQPGDAARRLAEETGKDPRLVQVVLHEARAINRYRPGLIIAEHRLGFICANAGVDHSNVAGSDEVISILPLDPDRSARELAQAVQQAFGARVAVIISDSHGRPHREGAVGVAIGVAGLAPARSYVGQTDRYGYVLRRTVEAVADELASAAGLLQGQADEGTPVVLVRGAPVQAADGRAGELLRPPQEDLYR